MIAYIDRLLDKITMYRLVLYFLILLLLVAAFFGAIHVLPYNPIAILFSSLALLGVCFITNQLFSKAFNAPANVESVYITAFILALIITPVMPTNLAAIPFLIWAAIWAMAAKYILAISKKHIFNPAAFAVALTAFTIGQSASWWIGGNIPMMAFVILGGLLVVRKIQRFDLVITFLLVALGSILATSVAGMPLSTLEQALVHTPLFFFAFIMITEPMTAPPTRTRRIIYGAFVGILFAPALHIGSVYSTPELALLAGNILAYILSPKKKYELTLAHKKPMGGGIYDFSFKAPDKVSFAPGQYMEWTLAPEGADDRGNRRYFTLASSPTERKLHLGVRFYEASSSFKARMFKMVPGDTIMGGQLAGDFVMPKDRTKKLAFIAGGIGITPFRSMIKYLSDRGEQRDVMLLYSNRTPEEIAYRETFNEADAAIGIKTVYALTGKDIDMEMPRPNTRYGRIDAAMIAEEIPDYRERMFYVSGTQAMVSGIERTLHQMGIPRRHIKKDFFPGFG